MNLKIWLDHYIQQGVEKFYLIDNGSDDNPLVILQSYIDSGIVSYHFLPEKHKQTEHARMVILNENIKDKTEWLIVCDLDEFFYGHEKKLSNVLDEFSNYEIIYSNWRMFGSDGYDKHPENIIKSIVWREPEYDSHTKYIVRPNKIVNITDLQIHSVDNITNKITENEKIRLNHYPIQSLTFFKTVKMSRGAADSLTHENVRDMNYFYKYDQNKTMKDTVLANLHYL